MKTTLLLLATICAAPVFATENVETRSPYYVTGSFGINYGDTVDGEGNIAAFTGYGDDTGESYTLGMGYQYSENIRLEARYSHKDNDSRNTVNAFSPGAGKNIDGTANGDLKSDSISIDAFYDFTNDTKFTPYVKAGLGFTRNAYKVRFEVPEFGANDFYYDEKKSNEFTWNLGMGASYELNTDWALYTEYQIQSLGEIATKKDSFGDRFVSDNYLLQELNLGLRYHF